jgi:prefoldin subunit 5
MTKSELTQRLNAQLEKYEEQVEALEMKLHRTPEERAQLATLRRVCADIEALVLEACAVA